MWQRIQTIFLVIVIISLVASLILPIWSTGENQVLTAFYFLNNNVYQYFPFSITAIVAVSAITLAFIEVRKYKDRLLQMKLGALNSLLMAGHIFCAVYFSGKLGNEFQGGGYGLGLFLPGVAVICNFLANRFIRRDERLVRDSERLR